jgi:Tfp pilus assembly protein PilZ
MMVFMTRDKMLRESGIFMRSNKYATSCRVERAALMVISLFGLSQLLAAVRVIWIVRVIRVNRQSYLGY